MRSIKTAVLALTLVTTLAASAPMYAVSRKEQDRTGGTRIARFISRVMNYVGNAFDGIIIPHP
jgi:hypothetical protein